MNKIDIEVMVWMFIHNLKEEKNKILSDIDPKYNVVYIFNDFNEYHNYFIKNGFSNIQAVAPQLLDKCMLVKTKKGCIIAQKGKCDYAIRHHNDNKRLYKKYN